MKQTPLPSALAPQAFYPARAPRWASSLGWVAVIAAAAAVLLLAGCSKPAEPKADNSTPAAGSMSTQAPAMPSAPAASAPDAAASKP